MENDVKITKYKGYPVIAIRLDEKNGQDNYVRFGIKKAKAILKHINDIEDFVEKNTK